MDLNYKDLDGILELLNNEHHIAESMDDLAIRLATQVQFDFLKRISRISEDDDPTPSHLKPLFLILERLSEDNLISVFNKDAENTNKFTYAIRYRGIEFLSMGGYAEKIKQDKLANEKKENQKILVKIGQYAGILIGVYYLIQLLRELFPFLHNLFYH